MSEKILIIEDEEKIARFIELELSHEGYETTKVFNGRNGLEMAQSGHFDLILLHIMLPQINGLEVLRRLRRSSHVPVILLTARDAVMDKVSGLDMGADDYITKPFAIEELLARIRVCLKHRKTAGFEDNMLTAGKLCLDTSSRRVTYDNNDIQLTNREFILLRTLMENKSIVLSRDTLLNKVWGYDYMGETNIVDVYIYSLRNKIDDVFNDKIIRTVRGVGYIIK